MKKLFVLFAIAAALAFPATAILSQQTETPSAKEGQGMMSGGMQECGMMCPMMGTGGMGMMGGAGSDPKMMGRMMETRGEMMMKMGQIMMKYGKQMQKEKMK